MMDRAVTGGLMAMSVLDLELPDCLERWEDGSIRVAGHRVMLYHVLEFMFDGRPFCELESRFPTIAGETLRSVWDFCQEHPDLVRSYFREVRSAAVEIHPSVQYTGPSREELIERKKRRIGQEGPA
jgi:uncharacterized protein (DUF433 family)